MRKTEPEQRRTKLIRVSLNFYRYLVAKTRGMETREQVLRRLLKLKETKDERNGRNLRRR